MFRPVIVGYARSPFTMARKGELKNVKPVNLLAEVVKTLVRKSKICTALFTGVPIGTFKISQAIDLVNIDKINKIAKNILFTIFNFKFIII